MHLRILDMRFRAAADFERLYHDAATPPWDRHELWLALRELLDADDPRMLLLPTREHVQILEFVVRGSTSGHRYGMLMIDMGHVADVVAYWRDPPLYIDEATARPHGFSRSHALNLAIRRLEASR